MDKFLAFFQKKHDFQQHVIEYIDDVNESDEPESNLKDVMKLFEKSKIKENKIEFKDYLVLIEQISKNHHRSPSFFDKIESILLSMKDQITQTFSNSEIYDIFKNDKRILLFLINNQFINSIQNSSDENLNLYFHPEINGISKSEIENYEEFDQKRKIGENDDYISQLIRNDSVEEFIIYTNKNCISLESKIKPSIFETNSFLNNNKPNLIEYSMFYGSISIFNYLRMNYVDLKPSLWLYAIHSRNPSLIHSLEEFNVQPPNDSYVSCLKVAIECHHNEIAEYISDNLVDQQESNSYKIYQSVLSSRNYFYLLNDIDINCLVFCCCKFNYSFVLNVLLNTVEYNINGLIVINLIYLENFYLFVLYYFSLNGFNDIFTCFI